MATKRRVYWCRIVDGPHARPASEPGSVQMLSWFNGVPGGCSPGQRVVLTLPPAGAVAMQLVEAHEYVVDDWPARGPGTGVPRGTTPRSFGAYDTPIAVRHVGRVGDRPYVPTSAVGGHGQLLSGPGGKR